LLLQLQADSSLPDRQTSSYAAFERILQVVREHDPVITAKGRFGVVAKGTARPGDAIFAFGSAYCPFVAQDVSEPGENPRYTLCSPCYIDGMAIRICPSTNTAFADHVLGVMYGEAVLDMAKSRYEDETRVQDVLKNLLIG